MWTSLIEDLESAPVGLHSRGSTKVPTFAKDKAEVWKVLFEPVMASFWTRDVNSPASICSLTERDFFKLFRVLPTSLRQHHLLENAHFGSAGVDIARKCHSWDFNRYRVQKADGKYEFFRREAPTWWSATDPESSPLAYQHATSHSKFSFSFPRIPRKIRWGVQFFP
jgi:hypothetical protein